MEVWIKGTRGSVWSGEARKKIALMLYWYGWQFLMVYILCLFVSISFQIRELREEEPDWTNYDEDETTVKMQLTDTILDLLLSDSIHCLNEIHSKKMQSCQNESHKICWIVQNNGQIIPGRPVGRTIKMTIIEITSCVATEGNDRELILMRQATGRSH